MKRAACIGAQAHQITWELSEPLDGHSIVVTSAAEVCGTWETYIFPATRDGAVTDWLELPGSMRGTKDHLEALYNAGYEVGQ